MLCTVKPLFYDGFRLVVSRKNRIFILLEDGSEEFLAAIPVSFYSKILMSLRLLTRLFRLEVYSSAIHGETYYFCFKEKLYSYNKITKKLVVEMFFERGHGPLSFCCIEGLKGFDDTVYFGDYFGNHDCIPTSIYKRLQPGKWEKCHTFPRGSINHIHGLVKDTANHCIWILTGDYGVSFGIYRATLDFTVVESILIGDQKYRSCVAYPIAEGLLYATDSHLEKNTIRILKNNNGSWTSEEIAKTNGPVIYGTELLDYFVFATSVEPGIKKGNIVLTLLARDIGPGIINNQVEIVAISKSSLKSTVLEVNPKDSLPARLFQFGSACFPSNAFRSNHLSIYYTATKNYEGQLRDLELNDPPEKP
jgi:hypothetical protein